MGETGFEFHGPHQHQVQHAAEQGNPRSFQGTIAVVTAVLATIGAIFAYEESGTQAEAMIYKNNAAIAKTEANDQWSHYQAKSVKQNLAELGMALAPNQAEKDKYEAKALKYKDEQTEIQKKAQEHEAVAKHANEQSEAYMHQHHRWAQATTLLQVSIALAAIALLTQRKWLLYGVYGVSGFGIALGILASFGV